ncbi:MAG: NodT family efflux transporter outer membrane factor (OMF) lipoprotein [Verrucomicrobiales bacterium]|jgi:NodT family efflux transporter outer membrane factor (OMF) lipoprotein
MAGCLWTPPSSLPLGDAAVVALAGVEPSAWWKSFRDPELSQLVDTALAGNLEIKQAAARIRQAEASARKSGALLFPSVDGQARMGRDRSGNERARSSLLGALFRWEIDLWGRLRSVRAAALEETLASRADALGVRVLLTAAVAEAYFTAIEHAQKRALLERQIKTNLTLLELTQLRFGQGAASMVDVLQQREQLTSTQARLPLTEASLESARYRLAVLLGRSSSNEERVAWAKKPFPKLSQASAVSTEAVLKRPDMIARQHRIFALDHQVGRAIAERMPTLTLSASSALTDSSNFDGLVSNAVAELVAPLVDGGERKAEVSLRRAALEEGLHAYGQAYLEAAEELKGALIHEEKQREHLRLLRSELATAKRLLNETRNRYSQGLTDYLPVLAAVDRVQELERSLITNEHLLLSHRIQRYRALGGH